MLNGNCCQVTSKKDQEQYWADPSKPYVFMPAPAIAEALKHSRFGRSVETVLSVPIEKSMGHPLALSKTKYAVSRWMLFKACFEREILLIKRHTFLYVFRTLQVLFSPEYMIFTSLSSFIFYLKMVCQYSLLCA